MEKGGPRMIFGVTRPLQPPQRFETTIAHAGVVRAQAPQLVPDRFGRGMTPLVSQQARQVAQNGNVIASLARWLKSLSDTLDAPLAIRDRPLCFAPTRRR